MKETNIRSFVKAVSWRFIATCLTFSIAYIFTGELKIALEIGGFDMAIKLVAYFFHERIWGHINLGRIISPLSDIVLKTGVKRGEVVKKLKEMGYVDD